jgi:hypothetical protein
MQQVRDFTTRLAAQVLHALAVTKREMEISGSW